MQESPVFGGDPRSLTKGWRSEKKFSWMKRIAATLLLLLSLASGPFAEAAALGVVTSLDPLEAREYIMAFEQETGIPVQWIRLSAGEALARLKSEAGNPTQDVWFGGPVTELIAAKNAGLLDPYHSPVARAIPKRWRDPEGYWTGIYFGAIVFISGKGHVPPGSWRGLLDPRYRGEVVVSYPYTAGTGYTVLAGLAAMMGEEGALAYSKELDGQVRRYTKSGGAPIIEVGLGEAGVGICFEQDAVRKGVSRGFPIVVSVPEDGVPYEIGGVGIIRGKRSPEAERFVDWIVSLPAQNLMHTWYRTPLHPEAAVSEKVHRPGEMNLAPEDMEAAGAARAHLITAWRERVGK